MFRPKSNLEGFVWSHQSKTGLISQRKFAPKCYSFAIRPLGCCSFQNILTNAIISQINTLLLQCAKKVVSDSPGHVDFATGLVIFVLNLPNGQVLFFDEEGL